MASETIDERKHNARARHAYEHDARAREMKTNWFTALVAIGFVAWMFIPASGLMPQPVWAAILGLLVIVAFAIAIFAPRNSQPKPH